MDRPVSREGPIVGVTETPPGTTASPSKVRVAVWVNAPPVSPGDDPPVAEDIVINVKGGSRGLDSPDLLKLRAVVDRGKAGNKGVEFRPLNHDASVSGTGVPLRGINASRL